VAHPVLHVVGFVQQLHAKEGEENERGVMREPARRAKKHSDSFREHSDSVREHLCKSWTPKKAKRKTAA
jgi:hypothetical protein